jgi:hypothetical protein
VVLAAEQGADVLDVEGFLADQGHDWRTIESVLAYLGSDAAMSGTGTVLEFPVRRQPCSRDVDRTGCERTDRAVTSGAKGAVTSAASTGQGNQDRLTAPAGGEGG